MPKNGFKAITVPSTLYEQLKIIAETEKCSISDIISLMLSQNFDFLYRFRKPLVRGSNPLWGSTYGKFSNNSLTDNHHLTNNSSRFMVQYSDSELSSFETFLKRKLRTKRTVKSHLGNLRKFLLVFDGKKITDNDIQNYLSQFKNKNTYRNHLNTLKVYFGKYLNVPIVQDFKVPQVDLIPKTIPTKKDLQRFFSALENNRDRALFLLFASSGLRRQEVFTLKLDNIDFKSRALLPSTSGSTKRAWASFYNKEAEFYLTLYLNEARIKPNEYLFKERFSKKIWSHARQKTGLNITPQVLREWFAEELSRLGVPERYVNAFCGRVPRSVLARHYTDYSLKKMKEIYDSANLTVLS